MKIIFIVIAMLVGLLAIVVLVGFVLPVQHTARRSAQFRASSSQVWTLITDFENAPAWRSDIRSVEKLQTPMGTNWKEIQPSGDSLTYATLETIPNQKLVRKIIDQGLPFGGSWTFQLQDTSSGCLLTIIENGEVYNPVYRFVSKFIMGHSATMDQYLKQLRKKLGEV